MPERPPPIEAGDVLVGDPGEVGPVGVDLQAELEDLRDPSRPRCCRCCRELAHESLDLIAEPLGSSRGLGPEMRTCTGTPIGGPGLDLLDDRPVPPVPGSAARRLSRSAEPRYVGDFRGCGPGSGRNSARAARARSRARIGARRRRRRWCRPRPRRPDQPLDRLDRLHRLGLGLADRRPLGQERLTVKPLCRSLGKKLVPISGRRLSAPPEHDQADGQRRPLVLHAPLGEAVVDPGES